MSILSLIIKREFIAKVRNKSFIVMTFLSPLLFVGMAVLIGYLANINQGEIKKIAVYDQGNFFTKDELVADKKYEYHYLSDMDFDKAKEIASESYEALLYVPENVEKKELTTKVEYLSDNSPSMDFIYKLENIIEDKITKLNIESSGVDYSIIENSKVDANIHLAKFSGEDSIKGLNGIKIAIGSIFGYLIMMFIMIYGNFVMRSVIEEKTNRIIEIIVSSVKPFQLMMGKILGNSLAGLLQFFIWAVVGVILYFVAASFFGLNMGGSATAMNEMSSQVSETDKAQIMQTLSLYFETIVSDLPWVTIILSFFVFFAGGYFLYSSVYAAIGAAVDNETDSQQFLMPIIMPLMLAVYIGFFTVMDDPHGSVAVVFSLIPFTSPIVMLMRIPFGVPIWQVILSAVLLYATFLFIVWAAAKIYRVGILMYGKKPTWKELYKWMKY
jgi:ABC-2 type transport system permease protein